MKRNQLNISIDPELLKRIKESARKSGKSITGYVTDCCSSQLEEIHSESINSRFNKIERRLESIEKNLSLIVHREQKVTPFTPEEAINCNEFIKAIFENKLNA